MSSSGGSKAIIAAFLANIGIALAKFIAWFFSGSASMLAEGIHSVADSGNQLLLLLGGRRAKRRADLEHPFGHGRERFIYAFIVAIILFSVGGLFSIYEGVGKILEPHELDHVWLAVLVLVIAIVLEGFSLRTAVGEARPHRRRGESWFGFIRHAKAPELPVVLLEDTAALTGLLFALLGVGLSWLTGNPLFDAIGTLLIGTLLIVVAITLGAETKSLLVGEGARPADREAIVAAIEGGPQVHRLIHLKTLYLGPEELLVAAKLAFAADLPLSRVAADIDAVEARIRDAVPDAGQIYLEPDVYRPEAATPPTEAIILKSED